MRISLEPLKVFERTPLAYRKQGIVTPLYAKANVLQRKLNPNPYLGGIRMDYQLRTKAAFKLIGYELKTTCKDGQNHRDIPFLEHLSAREQGEPHR